MTELPPLVLASGSPRRSEILTSVGWPFIKDVPDVDETEFHGEDPAAYVERLARTKASVVAEKHRGSLVLGADTTVVINGSIIGKPADLDDARRMLRLLADSRHDVLTGVALVRDDTVASAVQRTAVDFGPIDDAEIELLVQKGGPLDKAGAYAVQAQAALFITGIQGDYWNVVGLPVNLVYRLAAKFLS
mgnify:CR=1 FL=1